VQLQSFTKTLKNVEKDYIKKMQELYGEDAFKYDEHDSSAQQ